jgi:hypothetical protein
MSFITAATSARGDVSNEAQGQALSQLDDETWVLLVERERTDFITVAASERGVLDGDATMEADGRRVSRESGVLN